MLEFPGGEPSWRPWHCSLAGLQTPDGLLVDRAVVSFFEAPHSYTAEDVVEISLHGSPVVLQYALERACEAGARLAEPGEFTLRAFLNGRIDLVQAEAVNDLIQATTLYQARIAAQQSEGSLSRRVAPIKEHLLELIALLEAGIDFADDDVPVAGPEEITRRIRQVELPLSELLTSYDYGRLVHEGLMLAIVGRPNVGKSSLFNRLLERDRSIVTEIAGTTRDVVSETASIEGIPVKFLDTAGIRSSQDLVEGLGVQRTYQAMADADVTVVVFDLSQPLEAADAGLLEHARSSGKYLLAGNKSDLERRAVTAEPLTPVSALTGDGIDILRAQLVSLLAPPGRLEQEGSFLTNLRHRQALQESLTALQHAAVAVDSGLPHELLLLDLYAALQPIDTLTGATTADDILNRIFATFCIGK